MGELHKIEMLDRNPFKCMVATIGNLPTNFVDSMSYYECIAWLVQFLRDRVIPTVNNNAIAVEELQRLYIELHDYVENYFDNLDVQEEINNKLDEMAEAGTLQEIIAAYIQSNVAWTFDTVSDMQAGSNLVDGSYARTLGYNTANDGGSALYKIRTKTNEDTPDGGFLIAIGETLVAELVIENCVSPEMFGAVGDGTTDDNEALSMCFSAGKNVILTKEYYNSADITVENLSIIGNDGVIKCAGITTTGNIDIENIKFKNIDYNAINTTSGSVNLRNCKFEDIGIAEDLVPNNQGAGIFSTNTTTETIINIDGCLFKHCHSHGAVFTTGNHKISIRNSEFVDNFYRAIHLYGNKTLYTTKGVIENNIIKGCGKINTTDSGVGCNGIYSTCGKEVDVLYNTITDCYENGVEGRYHSIVGNDISYTNNDMAYHPTPSVEGIYLESGCDFIVKDNVLTHVKRRGICCVNTASSNEDYWLIENNKIDVDDYSGQQYSIYIGIDSGYNVKNKHILNNITTNPIYTPRPDNSCTYSGNLDLFTAGSTIGSIHLLSTYNPVFSYNKLFDTLDGWTYSNCSPTIEADAGLSTNVVHWDYQQYNRVVSPQLPYCAKASLKLRTYAKGKFNINIYKGSTLYKTIMSVDSNSYATYEADTSIASTNNEKLYVRFEVASSGSADIQAVEFNMQYC